MESGHVSEERRGTVDGLGVSVNRSEQALIAAGPEWTADCFIDRGKSGGIGSSAVLGQGTINGGGCSRPMLLPALCKQLYPCL